MSDDKFSISELQQVERDLTVGPWRYESRGWIDSTDNSLDEVEVLLLGARNRPEDGHGVVDLRNAAPILLEIAAAALAEQSTACDCDGESRCDDNCSALRAALAYHAALAKVRP